MKRSCGVRKCKICGRIIFRFIPTGKYGLFGEELLDRKEEIPWVLRLNSYYCKECWAEVGDGK